MNDLQEIKNMQRDLLDGAIDTAHVLSEAQNVSPHFMPHYFDMTTGKHGLENSIIDILAKNDAIFPLYTLTQGNELVFPENTNLRGAVIARGMLVTDIISEVEKRFSASNKRYGEKSVKQYIAVFMKNKGIIRSIKMTPAENKNYPMEKTNRPSFKPRHKIILVKEIYEKMQGIA